jgi:hypothetical protein
MILAWFAPACVRHRRAGLTALLALGSVWVARTRLGLSADAGAPFAARPG